MAILDQYGRPVRTAELRREIAAPTVTGVRSIISEHPAQGLTPGRLAALLRDAEHGDARDYLELAEDMEERNLHYSAVLGTRKRQTAQLDVRVLPADDSAEAERDAALVRDWLDAEPLEDELVDILDAVGKGYSVTEIIWDVSERQWMPKRLEFRDPRWCEFDYVDGRTLHLRDLENQREPLPAFKFITHVFRAKSGLPIRGGFARLVAWFYLFANYSIRDWMQFVETYGQPVRIGKFPPNATEPDKQVLLRALSNLGSDAAAMIPESMLIELIETRGSSGSGTSSVHGQLLAYIDALISKAVLGQTLTTEVGDSGSRALGDVHDEVRHDIERSDATALAQTLTRDLVVPVVALNHGERRRYPKIELGRAESIDVARISDALAKLVPLGLRVGEAEVRDKLGFGKPEDGDEVLGATDGGEPGADPRDPPAADEMERAMAPALARTNAATRVDDDIDRAIAAHIDGDGWVRLMSPAVRPVRDAVRDAGSLEALRARIGDGTLITEMDTDALAELLWRLQFSAEASGAG